MDRVTWQAASPGSLHSPVPSVSLFLRHHVARRARLRRVWWWVREKAVRRAPKETPDQGAGGAAYVTPRRVPSSFVSDPRRVAPLRGSCLRRVMRRKGSVGKETAWREEERRLSRGLCCLRYPPPSLGSLMIATLSIRPCEGPTEGRSHA